VTLQSASAPGCAAAAGDVAGGRGRSHDRSGGAVPPACCSTPRVVPRHVLPLLLESEGRFPALLLLVDN